MTTKTPEAGKMPRSNALYQEYEEYLAKYYLTYSHYSALGNTEKNRKFQELLSLLNALADNSHVKKPETIILTEKRLIKKFSSQQEALCDVIKLYEYFKNVHWNKKDKEYAIKLHTVLSHPIMVF